MFKPGDRVRSAAEHYRKIYELELAPAKVGLKHTAETAASTREVFEDMTPYRMEANTLLLEKADSREGEARA